MRGSASFLCPITLTPAEPVEADEVTGQRLRVVFGQRLAYLEQGWLLYLAEGAQSPPAWPDDPVAEPFLFAGPADQVLLRSEYELISEVVTVLDDVQRRVAARVRVVADDQWRTMRYLNRQVLAPDPWAARYVSLVADRFDERGWRVERIAAARCRADPFELLDGATAVELTPYEGLWWWGAPPGSLLAGAAGTVTGVEVPGSGGLSGGDRA